MSALASCVSPSRTASGGGLISPIGIGSPRRSEAIAATREQILRIADGTYIGRLLAERDSMLDRWRDRSRAPIRVWIEPLAANGDFPLEVRRAFAEWEDIGLPLTFQFVDRANDAEVTVRWTPQLVNKTGNTVWRVDSHGWMEEANIVLATNLSSGRPLDMQSLRAIALHEIGHLLGLGHSDNTHDVMAPLVRVASLSASDRATVQLLYTLPAGRVR